MQAGCAGATFAGASSADSILRLDLHAHVAMTRAPLDICDM